jgi:response regulator RpfG family c-di-GMP phosphodiesterase
MNVTKIDTALALLGDSKSIIDELVWQCKMTLPGLNIGDGTQDTIYVKKSSDRKNNILVINNNTNQLRVIKSVLKDLYNIKVCKYNDNTVDLLEYDIIIVNPKYTHLNMESLKRNNVKVVTIEEDLDGEEDYFLEDVNKENLIKVLNQLSQVEHTPLKKSILYIDDDLNNLVSFKAYFREDFNVSIAENALQAFNILETKNIDVVISDNKMSGQSGVEILEQIYLKLSN